MPTTLRKINAALKKIRGSVICTVGAAELQVILGGTVMGYASWDNPTAELCQDEDGHDFLVLDEYLVDFWAKEFKDGQAVLHFERDAEEIARLYGPDSLWVKVPIESDYIESHFFEVDQDD